MEQQPRVETVEEFKLRIAAIIRAEPEQIPGPPRPHSLLVRRKKSATYRKAKRRIRPRVTVYIDGTPLDGYEAVYNREVAPHERILIPFSEFARGDRRFNPFERKVVQAMVYVDGHDAPIFSFR